MKGENCLPFADPWMKSSILQKMNEVPILEGKSRSQTLELSPRHPAREKCVFELEIYGTKITNCWKILKWMNFNPFGTETALSYENTLKSDLKASLWTFCFFFTFHGRLQNVHATCAPLNSRNFEWYVGIIEKKNISNFELITLFSLISCSSQQFEQIIFCLRCSRKHKHELIENRPIDDRLQRSSRSCSEAQPASSLVVREYLPVPVRSLCVEPYF